MPCSHGARWSESIERNDAYESPSAARYAAIALTCDRSNLMPGPIVVEIVTPRI